MGCGNTDFGGLDVLADVKVLNICNTSGGVEGVLGWDLQW